MVAAASKSQLQSKLNLPCRAYRAADLAEARAGYQSLRYSKGRMIENVERLRPNLHSQLFRDRIFAEQGEVNIAITAGTQLVPAGSAKRIRLGHSIGALVEPECRRRIVDVRVTNQVRAILRASGNRP